MRDHSIAAAILFSDVFSLLLAIIHCCEHSIDVDLHCCDHSIADILALTSLLLTYNTLVDSNPPFDPSCQCNRRPIVTGIPCPRTEIHSAK